MINQRIPIFTDDPGWHGKRLAEAFAQQGYEAVFLSLKACALNLTGDKPRVYIPGFESALPQYAFVRGVPGGSVQQVIARLDILHALEMLGVRVYNTGKAIERTVDKAMTSFLLKLNAVPTPDTWVCESREQAQAMLKQLHQQGREIVLKPLFGSQGQGIRLIKQGEPLPVPMERHVDGVYYLQAFVDSGQHAWHDYRVFIIAGKAVATMVRHGNTWVNNVAQGGRCEAVQEAGEVANIAEAAAAAVNIDYCGVDVIQSIDGKLYVLEVNSIPAWRGLQSVVEFNIAEALVRHLLTGLTK